MYAMLRARDVDCELKCVRRDYEFGRDGGSIGDQQAIHLTIRGISRDEYFNVIETKRSRAAVN